jgi:hypothetical protein
VNFGGPPEINERAFQERDSRMAEVFAGDLSQIRLLDILNLLIHEGKTGRVTVKKGGTVGEIFVEQGRIIHGTAGSASGEDAVYLMMTWMIGKFSYTPDVLPDSRSVATPTEQLLSQGVQQVQEWDRIRKAIPSTETAFRLSSRHNTEDIVLKSEDWNTLICLDGVKTMAEIARELKISEIETAKKLYRLLSAKLIETAERPRQSPKRVIGRAFFDIVLKELVWVMGPMAQVVMEDHIADMGEEISAFPKERAAELVEGISHEISNEGKRIEFQKRMVEILRKI